MKTAEQILKEIIEEMSTKFIERFKEITKERNGIKYPCKRCKRCKYIIQNKETKLYECKKQNEDEFYKEYERHFDNYGNEINLTLEGSFECPYKKTYKK